MLMKGMQLTGTIPNAILDIIGNNVCVYRPEGFFSATTGVEH